MKKLHNFSKGFITIVIAIVITDLVFKTIIVNTYDVREIYQIFGGLITIGHVPTLRMSFGSGVNPMLLDTGMVLLFVILLFLFIKIQKIEIDKLYKYAITLIVFGWIGNYIDRIFLSKAVSNYQHLDYFNISGVFRSFTNLSSIIAVLGWLLSVVAIVVKFRELGKIFKKN